MSNITKKSSKRKNKLTFGFSKIEVFDDLDESSGNESLGKMG